MINNNNVTLVTIVHETVYSAIEVVKNSKAFNDENKRTIYVADKIKKTLS